MSDAELDRWQYRLSERPAGAAGAKAGAVVIGRHQLETGPGLPVTRVTDAAGEPAGLLLGFAKDLAAGALLAGSWRAPARLAGDADAFAERVLDVLGGHFLWLFVTDRIARIYPDCSAQVTCVYDVQGRRAGATAHALFGPGAYEERLDKALFARLGVDGEGWFPAGLTAHRGVERLLPNHYLDLDSWETQRFWPSGPLGGPLGRTQDPGQAVTEMIALVQTQIEALLNADRRVALALTAGHETRLLLACARPYLSDIDVVTVVGSDGHARDTVIARRIAQDLGLRHVELPRVKATAAQRELFIRRGGHCNADSNSHYHPSVWPIAETHHFIGGLGGEVGRAFLWRAQDHPATAVTAGMLVSRLGLPAEGELIRRMEGWLSALPSSNAFDILDLAYIEHRCGPWYAAQFCCDPSLARFAPIFCKAGVELMLALPPEWKRGSRLGHEIIERQWPELLAYPFNSLGLVQDYLIKLRRAAADPRVLVKKLRKLRQ